jgi:hypothetical protein
MTELLATFVSARVWLGTVICAGLFLVAALLGFFFRSRRFWGVAIALITVDLILAVCAAWLDRFGSH